MSTGTKAVFLNPTDALHGDIGIVNPGDLLVCFSKSGATEELLRLVPFARVGGAGGRVGGWVWVGWGGAALGALGS